jgi:Plasmid pRiA4b ORF-3-like protein
MDGSGRDRCWPAGVSHGSAPQPPGGPSLGGGRTEGSTMGKHVYQLKATILDTKPPVWRRLVVPEDLTLSRLHDVLQAAFDWWDYHLHEFEIGGERYGVDDGEDWQPPKDERRTRLRSVAGEGSSFLYVYDFGDWWRHKIVVEKVIAAQPGARYPACVGGRRACPPEDCGGPWGFSEFLAAIRDPAHEEHESMLEWVGGHFDPEAFDPADVKSRLDRPHLAVV